MPKVSHKNNNLKLFIPFITLIALNAFGESQLPVIKDNQEICFMRKYTAEHLKANPNQKIKAAFGSIYRRNGLNFSRFGVMNLKGKILFTSGAILTKLLSSSLKVTIEGRGEYLIQQNQKENNKITLRITSDLVIKENNWMIDESIPEGTNYDKMSLTPKSTDSIMVLERLEIAKNESCRKIMEQLNR